MRAIRFVLPGVLIAAALYALAYSSKHESSIERPGAAYFQTVLARTEATPFHFRTTVTGRDAGRIESGDWQPPRRFRFRIDDRELSRPGADQRLHLPSIAIGRDRYYREDNADRWQHQIDCGYSTPGGQVFYALANARNQPVEIVGNRYTIGTAYNTISFWVEGGYIVRYLDSQGYDTRLSRFGADPEIRRPPGPYVELPQREELVPVPHEGPPRSVEWVKKGC